MPNTTEEQLKQMGLLDRYQQVKSGEVAVPGYNPQQGVSKSETDAQKVVDEVSPTELGSPSTNVDFSQAPNIGTNAGDVTAGANNLQAQFDVQLKNVSDTYESMLKDQEDRLAKASKEKESYLSKLTGAISKREEEPALDTQALYKEALAEYGMTPEKMQEVQGLIGQVTTYNQQMVDLDARKMASLDRMEDRPGIDMGFMTREQQRITRDYDRQISTKAAQAGIITQQIQMQRGLFDDARATANQIVSAATYDQRQKLADMDWAIDTYSGLFGIMDAEEKDAWDTAYSIQKEELNRQTSEMTAKLNMMTSAGENGVKLGWTMEYMNSKSIEELTTEYSNRMAERPGEVGGVDMTADMKNYQLALGQGYTGSFAEWSGKGTDRDALIEEIAYIKEYEDREEALNALGMNQTALVMSFGVSGYNQLLDEVDKIYPPPPEAPKKKHLTPAEAGRNVGEIISHMPGAYEEAFIKTPLRIAGEAGTAVGGFFKGLFGR